MLTDSLVHELRRLDRPDKLRAVQILLDELAASEESGLQPGGVYELVTPYGNEAAAQALAHALDANRAKDRP